MLRRERDSNPRNSYPFTAFRVRPDRPLRHLSFRPPSGCRVSFRSPAIARLPCFLNFPPLLHPASVRSFLKLAFRDCKYRDKFSFPANFSRKKRKKLSDDAKPASRKSDTVCKSDASCARSSRYGGLRLFRNTRSRQKQTVVCCGIRLFVL